MFFPGVKSLNIKICISVPKCSNCILQWKIVFFKDSPPQNLIHNSKHPGQMKENKSYIKSVELEGNNVDGNTGQGKLKAINNSLKL